MTTSSRNGSRLSDIASELSSVNNLIYSDLDSTLNTSKYSSTGGGAKVERRKLLKSILREDTDSLKKLICEQDIHAIKDKHQNTLLHIACGFGRLKSVQILYETCPELIYEVDDKQHNPVDVAIKHGQVEIIKWLIQTDILSQFDLSGVNSNQRSMLHLAAKHGENEILRLICEEMSKSQFSLDIQDFCGNTAAHLAAKYNHLDCLQTLVEYNCDTSIRNKYGHTPCFIAEYNKNTECVHYLMIVETCVNLSIKVVQLNRQLRETKTNNEVLKAQMDEAIAINNDFINQRENALYISLEMMQKYIFDLESQIHNQIEQMRCDNEQLRRQLGEMQQGKVSERHRVQFNDQHDDVPSTPHNSHSIHSILKNIDATRTELTNTRHNCNQILNMDHKKIENVKLKFDEISKTFSSDSSTDKLSTFRSLDEFGSDNKEHLEIMRKMYQESTHRLMIFRNKLKEQQIKIQTNLTQDDGLLKKGQKKNPKQFERQSYMLEEIDEEIVMDEDNQQFVFDNQIDQTMALNDYVKNCSLIETYSSEYGSQESNSNFVQNENENDCFS